MFLDFKLNGLNLNLFLYTHLSLCIYILRNAWRRSCPGKEVFCRAALHSKTFNKFHSTYILRALRSSQAGSRWCIRAAVSLSLVPPAARWQSQLSGALGKRELGVVWFWKNPAQMSTKKDDFPSHPFCFCEIHEIRRRVETEIRDPQCEKLPRHLCRIFWIMCLWITHHQCRYSLYPSWLSSQCSRSHMDVP